MNSVPKSYVAFFDLDKTILSINSGRILVKKARKTGLMSGSDFLTALYYSLLYKFNLKNTDVIISNMGKWLNGIEVGKVVELCENIVEGFLVPAIRPEIIEELNFHREKNAELVILSSAISQICNPLSSYLNFDAVICTEMQEIKGKFTGFPQTKFCFQDEKRIQIIKYCELMSYSKSEAFYYGDSIADLPAMETVGNPVCISPDKKLKKIAHTNNWKIIVGKKIPKI